MDYIKNYINKNKDRFVSELIELLKIPSISSSLKFTKNQTSKYFISINYVDSKKVKGYH